MFVPASVYYTNNVINGADKVKGQAFMTMAISVCSMLGSLLGGVMLDSRGGVTFTLLVGTIVTIIGVIMLIFITPHDGANKDDALH